MSAKSRAEKHQQLVRTLASVVEERQRDLDALVAAQRALQAREYATRAVDAQTEALLKLSLALRKQREHQQQQQRQHQQQWHASPGTAQSCSDASTGTGGAVAHNGCSAADGAAATQLDDVADLMQRLREGDAGLEPPGGGGGAGGGAPGGARRAPVPIGWCPERAAREAAAFGLELTTDGLRARLRDLVAVAGCLLPRVYNSAPDMDAALQRLEDVRSELLRFTALIVVDPPPGLHPLTSVAVCSLDETAEALSPPIREHFVYAVSQINLEQGQMERVTALLELSRAHQRRVSARRNELMDTCAARAADVVASEALLTEVNRLQRLYAIGNAACIMALFGTLLTAPQFAAYAVGSFPYPPSKTALTEVLLGDSDGSAAPGAEGAAAGGGGGWFASSAGGVDAAALAQAGR